MEKTRRIPSARVGIALFGASLVILGAVAWVTTWSGTTAQDTEYLDNFDLGPSQQEQIEAERARGLEGDLHVPTPAPPPPSLKPELFGPFLLIPDGWVGELPAGSDSVPHIPYDPTRHPSDPSEEDIRMSSLWRDPVLPDGFALVDIGTDGIEFSVTQRWARADESDPGYDVSIDLLWGRPQYLPFRIGTWGGIGANVFETTQIDGNPSVTWQPPDGVVEGTGVTGVTVWIFDETDRILYIGKAYGNVTPGELLSIVRSLYR